MSGDDLTDQILRYITSYQNENGYSPSYREIAGELGIGSINTVSRYLLLLKAEGRVDWKPGYPRTLQIV